MAITQAKSAPKAAVAAPLNRSRLYQADHFRTIHCACVEQVTSREQLLDPMFWKHVSAGFHIGDLIEVYDEGMSFWGRFMVRGCGEGWATLAELEWKDFDPAENAEPDPDYKVEYGNRHTKYRIIRLADRHVVKDNIETKSQAERDLADYLQALRR